VHRDIKPDNFLLGGSQGQTVKLCDFGLAVAVPVKGQLIAECGTSPYKAPEMLHGFGYLQKVDIWSMGVSAYLILFGDYPFLPHSAHDDYEDVILRGTPEPDFRRSGECQELPSEHAVSFVRALLARAVTTRCTAAEALNLPLITEGTPLASPSATLITMIGKAQQRTQEFDMPADPTKYRGVDEILELLNNPQRNSEMGITPFAWTRVRHFSFSGGFTASRTKLSGFSHEDAREPQPLFKSGTHDGSMSLTAFDFWPEHEESTEAGDSLQDRDQLIEEELDHQTNQEEVEVVSSSSSEKQIWSDLPGMLLT